MKRPKFNVSYTPGVGYRVTAGNVSAWGETRAMAEEAAWLLLRVLRAKKRKGKVRR